MNVMITKMIKKWKIFWPGPVCGCKFFINVYFLFPSCFSMLTLSLEKLLACYDEHSSEQVCSEVDMSTRVSGSAAFAWQAWDKNVYQPQGMQKEFTKWCGCARKSAEHYFGQRKYGEHTIVLIVVTGKKPSEPGGTRWKRSNLLTKNLPYVHTYIDA